MAKKNSNLIGSWAFLVGVILAAVLGLGFAGSLDQITIYALVVIGLLVGILNIASEETTPFLMSGAVLVIVSSLGGNIGISYVDGILDALLVLFVPATIIVAIRNVFSISRR